MVPITGAKRLKLVAAAMLGASGLLILIVGGGLIGGLGDALFVLFFGGCPLLLGWLGLRRPGWSGLALLGVALLGLGLTFLAFGLGGARGYALLAWFLVFMVVPLVAGVLFLVAGLLEASRRRAATGVTREAHPPPFVPHRHRFGATCLSWIAPPPVGVPRAIPRGGIRPASPWHWRSRPRRSRIRIPDLPFRARARTKLFEL
jgi:hypothetical protein